MASLGDFWDKKAQSEDFLELQAARNERTEFLVEAENELLKDATEQRNALITEEWNQNREKIEANALANGCTSTSQCPSGYGCVDGTCKQFTGGGFEGQFNGAGPCGGNGPSPCNSGGAGSCQQVPTCGEEDPTECCGSRCCYTGSASSARPGFHCYCGDCPPLPGCDVFCAAYLQANGEVGPGCTEGPDGNSCDSCHECQTSGLCTKKSFNTPCWCEDEGCAEDSCELCVTDPSHPDYGECIFAPTEVSCQTCQTVLNYPCPCSVTLDEVIHCVPYGENPWPGLHLKAGLSCEEVLLEKGINVGNCVNQNIECNCHIDCPDCLRCNDNGECEIDHACA